MIDTLLQQGWNYHDSDSERLARELERAPLSELTVAQAGSFLNLSNHTLGEHLSDWSRARQLAEAVCAQALLADAGSQAWVRLSVARYLDGDGIGAQSAELKSLCTSMTDALPVYIEVKLLTAIALVGSQRVAEGGQLYSAAVRFAQSAATKPSQNLQRMNRTAAIASNNLASQLLQEPNRTAEQNRLMQTSAEASLTFWKRCGTWENEERGLYLLALVANASADYVQALAWSDQALEVISENGGEPVDEAFIHLSAANAHLQLGDHQKFETVLKSADELAGSWDDDSLRGWFADERKKVVD